MTLKIFGKRRRLRSLSELKAMADHAGITSKVEDFLLAMMGALVLALSALALYICLAVMFV